MSTPPPALLPCSWPAPAAVQAWTTTRRGGVSAPPYATFNLAAHVGDAPERVTENRRRLAAALRLPTPPHWLTQVHGDRVVDTADARAPLEADGSFTTIPGAVCGVLTADCLPVLLCDRAGTRVAALHGGWRGLAAGILEAGVAALRRPGADLMAWLGPAIGPAAFEVGPEVRAALLARYPGATQAFRAGAGDRWQADVFALARHALARQGVTSVYGGGQCTFSAPETFFSYRRDGVTGRMATLVWLAS